MMLVISLAPSTAAYGDTNGSSQNNEASVAAVDEGDSLSNDEADEVAANSSTEAIAKSEDDSTSGDSTNILSDSAKDEIPAPPACREEGRGQGLRLRHGRLVVAGRVSTASDMPADLMAGRLGRRRVHAPRRRRAVGRRVGRGREVGRRPVGAA